MEKPMFDWLDIETAPMDEEKRLFYAPANKKASNRNAQPVQIRVDRRRKKYGMGFAGEYPETPYTHYMELPDLPKPAA